ncbi:large ribosomal subunit protein mL66 [Lepeophtheirus salmonis]|uniref:large ribosomal subunit protein mL66 n=1 Tax=Lepeophtheirus salmonis TaxID=72036 RepID=UPI001AEA7511|nr:28S ribosomal protein S18a, mitochondrial-like [Lepeophtheirus salmonis]
MYWNRLLFRRNILPNPSFIRGLKEIKVCNNKEKNTRTIEGVFMDSSRKAKLLELPQACGNENCHPFCKFSESHNVKHTDVLILNQFVDSRGKMLNRIDTGLCNRQYLRLLKLIKMSQKAGIMDDPKNYYVKNDNNPWDKNNTYWDERTIDIQWTENERIRRIKDLQK